MDQSGLKTNKECRTAKHDMSFERTQMGNGRRWNELELELVGCDGHSNVFIPQADIQTSSFSTHIGLCYPMWIKDLYGNTRMHEG